ncbi:Lysophospholipase, alpha-beta hydrolase superfamily [Sphingomonas sp. NFR04]|uniref:alpha/beta hydrolase n=1 Tax=Sphingomonas sp. NFR04 TaxID=1566283 RepID=UPI0008F4346E|nr:alpha/beta hydrolase [Sphingomonas sp. NFR04]SFJ24175.1 Lysophospholipase, alpha-beta hydrolase superfamily [Sphingomonas sp. NFR04]
MRTALAALALLGVAGCHPRPQGDPMENQGPISAEPVSLRAADGIRIAGVYTRAAKPKALLLLFHQAESGKDEYALLAPQLAQAGYSSLRIDQRAGGTLFGVNETVKMLGHSASYAEAKQDLDAAFAWARQQKLPIVLWGSSYSAALIFPLAAEHPGQVKALLAFSPGEYLDDKGAVARAAAKVTAPIFVTSAQDGKEEDAARAILAASPSKQKTQFVPKLGAVHGSSTLLRTKNPNGAQEAWRATRAFLDEVTRS